MSTYNPSIDLLKDKNILVTGAGDGIGAAVAKEYARHGATVILLGRSQEKLEQVYDDIEQSGYAQPAIYPLDLNTAVHTDYIQLSKTLHAEFGHLDGLLHNAAVLGNLSPLEHYDLRIWRQVMHVNLTAPMILTKVCLPLLRAAEDASVVFTSANVGFRGQAYWGAYSISKAGINNMAEILAEELEVNTNIRVNVIDPGTVSTKMHVQAYPGDNDLHAASTDSITPVYVYLMGVDSSGVTGERFHAQDF